MSLPILPIFPSDDSLFQQSERYRHYLSRFRSEMEGQEGGVSNSMDQGRLWGFFPPPAGNLVVDPGFEGNRSAWTLPAGSVVQESTSSHSGNYRILMDSALGYNNGVLVANASFFTPVVPRQLLIAAGYVLGISGATGTAIAYINFYDAGLGLVSTVPGVGVPLSASWQLAHVKAVVPDTAVYAQYIYQVATLSGQAAWDDMYALPIRQQVEPGESVGQVNFSSTAETVLTTATFGPTLQVPIAGTASLLTPVIIQANCVYGVQPLAGGDVTFRIRRANAGALATWPVLRTMPDLVAANGTLFIQAFDTAPDTTAQTWVLTAQMADSTGGATAEHSIVARQHYL